MGSRHSIDMSSTQIVQDAREPLVSQRHFFHYPEQLSVLTEGGEVVGVAAARGDRDDSGGDRDEAHLGEISAGDGVDAGADLIRAPAHLLGDL